MDDVQQELQNIREILAHDRKMMWYVIIITLTGAFALIGVKLVIP